MKKRRGFTLIELVMVVAILGVLSSIALVKYTDISKNSKENSDYITASNIATAAKLAMNDGKDIGNNYDVTELVKDGYLEGTPVVQNGKDTDMFKVYISDKKIVTVSVGGNDIYPKNK